MYRVTSIIGNNGRLGPYSRTILRAPWQSWGGLLSEVPLYAAVHGGARVRDDGGGHVAPISSMFTT